MIFFWVWRAAKNTKVRKVLDIIFQKFLSGGSRLTSRKVEKWTKFGSFRNIFYVFRASFNSTKVHWKLLQNHIPRRFISQFVQQHMIDTFNFKNACQNLDTNLKLRCELYPHYLCNIYTFLLLDELVWHYPLSDGELDSTWPVI